MKRERKNLESKQGPKRCLDSSRQGHAHADANNGRVGWCVRVPAESKLLGTGTCRISRRDLDVLSFAIQTTALDSGVVTKTPSSSRQGHRWTAASHDHITPSVLTSQRSRRHTHTPDVSFLDSNIYVHGESSEFKRSFVFFPFCLARFFC